MGDPITLPSVLQVDPSVWYQTRSLSFRPKHFVSTVTEPTPDSLHWVQHRLSGRYCLEHNSVFDPPASKLSFEDPTEAIFYELTWS